MLARAGCTSLADLVFSGFTKEDDLKEEMKTEELCFITHGFGGLRRAGRRFVDKAPVVRSWSQCCQIFSAKIPFLVENPKKQNKQKSTIKKNPQKLGQKSQDFAILGISQEQIFYLAALAERTVAQLTCLFCLAFVSFFCPADKGSLRLFLYSESSYSNSNAGI